MIPALVEAAKNTRSAAETKTSLPGWIKDNHKIGVSSRWRGHFGLVNEKICIARCAPRRTDWHFSTEAFPAVGTFSAAQKREEKFLFFAILFIMKEGHGWRFLSNKLIHWNT